MTLGEFQSVIQLAVALNSIYLSLAEIRNPSFREQYNRIQEARSRLGALYPTNPPAADGPLMADIARRLTDAVVVMEGVVSSIERVDFVAKIASLIVSLAFIGLLIWTAVDYHRTIDPTFITVTTLVGFAPILAGVMANIFVVVRVRSAVRPMVTAVLVDIATHSHENMSTCS